jgi:hypothetical protein
VRRGIILFITNNKKPLEPNFNFPDVYFISFTNGVFVSLLFLQSKPINCNVAIFVNYSDKSYE